MTFLVSAVIFGVLVLVHEGGHFLAARRAGVRVDEFGIGFGPPLLRWGRRATRYSLRLIPLGGFVRMAGSEPGEENEPEGFMRQPVGRRAGIIFAGPAMNLVLALLLFAFIFAVLGIEQPIPRLASVLPGHPAAQAGLQPGDLVVSVQGYPVRGWEEVVAQVQASLGKPLTLGIERAGQRLEVEIVPEPSPQDPRYGFVGVSPEITRKREAPGQALFSAGKETYRVTILWMRGLMMAIMGRVEARVMGPVGIGALIGQAARIGLPTLLYLAALLSANLGLINLLPIPALDGSRLLFLGIEAVRGRPIDPAKESLIHLVGFAILMLFFLFITYMDLLHLGA
ncbi:MAG TPA: RIP metalloprotease RseP [Firmicutes bacterium]|nr:RIP metalloprotease RseP [Bacillota bacterium]